MGEVWEREREGITGKGEGLEEGKKNRKEKRKGRIQTEGKQITEQGQDVHWSKVQELYRTCVSGKKVNEQVEDAFIYSTNTVSNIDLVKHLGKCKNSSIISCLPLIFSE